MTPVDIVAKHIRALRHAERGSAVGARITEEDREIAREILGDAYEADWRIVRLDHPCDDLLREHSEAEYQIAEEWTP